MELPGGVREQSIDPRHGSKPTPQRREHTMQSNSADYRRAVFAAGIPPRPSGLFPPGDALLAALAADPRCHAFEKHLPGEDSPYEPLPGGGWATGDAAAVRGVDLRLFYQDPAPGERFGTIRAAVRFGEGACMGAGSFMSAHGGSIETALDEATAEMAKLEIVPIITTREATFQLLKPVPLHTTLEVVCRIKEQKGIRCYVEGALQAPAGAAGAAAASSGHAGSNGGAGAGSGPLVFATCSAMLVDIKAWV